MSKVDWYERRIEDLNKKIKELEEINRIEDLEHQRTKKIKEFYEDVIIEVRENED